jgi:GntR family transcriptional regulator/MocR family aminotransferase
MARSPVPLQRKSTGPILGAHVPAIDLDSSAGAPLYEQLYLGLREQILAGRLPQGARLASTRRLADHLAVSRFTVVTALERLIAEGYLATRVGSGTFVTGTVPDHFTRPSEPRRPIAFAGPGRAGALSARGRRLASLPITGPRPEEPRAFQSRRAPLDEFPIRAWSSIVRRLWRKGGYRYLEYGEPAGHAPLRQAIAAHISVTRAVHCDPRQVVVTSGSQQAFDLLCRVLLDPGDRAWIEEPGYLDVRAALLASGADLVPVPVDGMGIDVAEGVRRGREARLAVVSPSHQYPAGVTLSATRRIELLNWARAAGAWIIEDDYDSYFRYAGRPMSALQGMERDAPRSHVIYVGTFSKTVFPSLRLGFCVVPDQLVDAVVNARAAADRHSPIVDQAALTEFITSGQYERHLRRMRMICHERYQAMRHHCARVLGDYVTVSPASAGTHVLAYFNHAGGRADAGLARRVAALAAEEGLVVFPLGRYCLKPPAADALVLGFGGLTPRRIAAGAEKLAGVIRRARRRAP